jgi:hypothetical protein
LVVARVAFWHHSNHPWKPVLFGAAKLNLKIVEMPIRYRERSYGETNMSRWKHGWLLLKMVVFASRRIKLV